MDHRVQADAPAVDPAGLIGLGDVFEPVAHSRHHTAGRSEQRVEHVLLDRSTFLQPFQLLVGEACLAARPTCSRTPPAPPQNGEAVAITTVS